MPDIQHSMTSISNGILNKEPPRAEPHAWWCERTENESRKKTTSFSSYSIGLKQEAGQGADLSGYVLGQQLVTLRQHFQQEGFRTPYEAFHANHHQDEAHEAHHDVVARLAQHIDQPGRGAQDEVSQQVDEGDGADQHAFQLYGLCILHQHDGIGDGTGSAEHGDAQRGDGDVVGVGLDFLVFQLHGRIACLQHIVANLEDDKSAGDAETVGGDAEELEQKLAGEGEDHDDDEGGQRGACHDEAALFLRHALGHGQKYGHGA